MVTGDLFDKQDTPQEQYLKNLQNDFKQELRAKGESKCPCCKRRARINKMSIHSTLAYMLCSLYNHSHYHQNEDGSSWVHLTAFKSKTASGNDFSIVNHWGLVEAMPANEDEDKSSSGYWRLTELGTLFVEGETTIPKNVFIFNNRVIEKSTERATIKECLGKKFSYDEIIEKVRL